MFSEAPPLNIDVLMHNMAKEKNLEVQTMNTGALCSTESDFVH